MDLTYAIPVAVFGGMSAMIWLLAERLRGSKSRVDQRLEEMELAAQAAANHGGAVRRFASATMALVWRTTPQLSRPLQPTNPRDLSRLRQRLSHGGFRSDFAQAAFLSLKLVTLSAGFFIGGGTLFLTTGYTQTTLLRLVVIACSSFFVPDIALHCWTKRRHEKIFLGLPDAVDLMVVCVEAGLGLDQVLRKVALELGKAHPVVASEFDASNMQLQMGSNRVQVLRDLALRNGEDELRTLSAVLINASRFGTGIGTALRAHSDAMRTRRRQLAEERAAKSAVKLIFPLVLFIFPAIFVVLVGPAAISIIRHLLPKMGGG